MQLRKYIPDSEDNALLALLALVGAVLGAKELLGLFITDEKAKYLLVTIVVVVIWRHAWRQYKTSRLLDLPSAPKIFNPFRIVTGAEPPHIWKRDQELGELLARIDGAAHSHLVVSGPSGAGKSTLISNLLKPALEHRGDRVKFLSRYDGFVVELIENFSGPSDVMLRQRVLAAKYSKFISENRCSIRDVFDPAYKSALADSLAVEITDYLSDVISREKCLTIFVCDQVERLVHLLKTDGVQAVTDFNGFEVYFFVAIARHLRVQPNVRTLFVIRAEYLYQSFVLLENTSTQPDGPDVHLVHFLCPGINTISSPDAVAAIREDFKKIPAAAPYAQKFERLNGLDSRAFSNTFLTQLLGFLVEHFYAVDDRIADLLERGDDRTLALRYYFDYLLNDYAKQSRASDALDMLKIVIFTIAVENRIAGQAVTATRLAALSHIPEESVKEAILFLKSSGLVLEETYEGHRAYRMVHDIISDYAIENEQFTVDSVLKDGVRGLSESCVPTGDLTPVTNFADPIKDWIRQPNIGLFAVWAFYAYGLAKVLFSSVCNAMFPFLSHIWAARDCEFVGHFYFAIYVTHVVWVTFIYFLDRGYFRYTLKNAFARFVSKLMPVMGVLLGVLFSQSPALFVVPVVSIGLVMSMLLILSSFDGTFVGRVADENRRWGLRTFFNMIITSLIMLITAVVLWETPTSQSFWHQLGQSASHITGGLISFSAADVPTIWMYLVNGIMIYFWWHISPEQRSRVSFAARLSVFDRARLETDPT